MSVYKEVVYQLDSYVGVICPIPVEKDKYNEFENPTSLDTKDICWEMKVIKPCLPSARKTKYGGVVILFVKKWRLESRGK